MSPYTNKPSFKKRTNGIPTCTGRTLTPARKLLISSLCVFVLSCTNTFPPDKIDPSGNMDRADYLALRHRDPQKAEKTQEGEKGQEAPPIPDLPLALDLERTVPALPESALMRESFDTDVDDPALSDKKVSVTITDSVPLRDVLIELGRQGEVNLEIDPRIEGGVIFTAHEQPFDTVLRRICDLAGLRYRADGAFVRIEVDEPYQHTYALDHLSLSRKAESEISIATNVFDVDVAGTSGNSGTSSSSSAQSKGGENNSTSKITGTAGADFWGEVEKSLPQVLATASKNRPLTTGRGATATGQAANFSIDRQAGLITVFGNARQQDAVAAFLNRLDQKASAQVLIEARIVEVELSDEFQSGVNWSSLFKGATGLAANFAVPGYGAAAAASSGLFSASLDTKDFNGILSLVRKFGATRVLSSPRLTVMNNQTAVLKVARNEVYFLTSA